MPLASVLHFLSGSGNKTRGLVHATKQHVGLAFHILISLKLRYGIKLMKNIQYRQSSGLELFALAKDTGSTPNTKMMVAVPL